MENRTTVLKLLMNTFCEEPLSSRSSSDFVCIFVCFVRVSAQNSRNPPNDDQSAPSKLVFKLLSCWFGPRFANFDPALCTYPCLTATTTVQKLALAANRQPVGQLSTTFVETLCGKDRKPKIASTQSQAHHPQTCLVPRHPVDDRPQVVVKQQRFLSTTYFKPCVCVPKPNPKTKPNPIFEFH